MEKIVETLLNCHNSRRCPSRGWNSQIEIFGRHAQFDTDRFGAGEIPTVVYTLDGVVVETAKFPRQVLFRQRPVHVQNASGLYGAVANNVQKTNVTHGHRYAWTNGMKYEQIVSLENSPGTGRVTFRAKLRTIIFKVEPAA